MQIEKSGQGTFTERLGLCFAGTFSSCSFGETQWTCGELRLSVEQKNHSNNDGFLDIIGEIEFTYIFIVYSIICTRLLYIIDYMKTLETDFISSPQIFWPAPCCLKMSSTACTSARFTRNFTIYGNLNVFPFCYYANEHGGVRKHSFTCVMCRIYHWHCVHTCSTFSAAHQRHFLPKLFVYTSLCVSF